MIEKKVIKLKSSQDQMRDIIKELKNCTDKAKAKKLEATLEKMINKNVKIIFGK